MITIIHRKPNEQAIARLGKYDESKTQLISNYVLKLRRRVALIWQVIYGIFYLHSILSEGSAVELTVALDTVKYNQRTQSAPGTSKEDVSSLPHSRTIPGLGLLGRLFGPFSCGGVPNRTIQSNPISKDLCAHQLPLRPSSSSCKADKRSKSNN